MKIPEETYRKLEELVRRALIAKAEALLDLQAGIKDKNPWLEER